MGSHCSKVVFQTNLPNLNVAYISWSLKNSTFTWATPYKTIPVGHKGTKIIVLLIWNLHILGAGRTQSKIIVGITMVLVFWNLCYVSCRNLFIWHSPCKSNILYTSENIWHTITQVRKVCLSLYTTNFEQCGVPSSIRGMLKAWTEYCDCKAAARSAVVSN